MSAPQRLSSQRILGTALALLSVQGVTWMSSLAVALVLPRLAGAEGLGVLVSAYTLAFAVSMIAAFGTTTAVTKAVARSPEDTRGAVSTTLVSRTVVWALLALLIAGGALVLVGSREAQFVIAAAVFSTAMSIPSETLRAALHGDQRLGRAAWLTGIASLVGQAAALAVILMSGSIALYAWMLAFSAAGNSLLLLRVFWPTLRGQANWALSRVPTTLRSGAYFFVTELSRFVYGNSGVLILSALVGARDAGIYALALRLAAIPVFLPTIVITSLLPALASAAVNDRRWLEDAVHNGVRIVALVTVPACAGMAILSPLVIRIVGGREFEESVVPMVILSMLIPLTMVDTLLGTTLNSLDRQAPWSRVATVAAIFNPMLAAVAIPLADSFIGRPAVGLAGVALLTEAFMSAGAVWLLRDVISLPRLMRPVSSALLAAASALLAYSIVASYAQLAAGLVVGASVYLGVSLVSGLVTKSDLRWLQAGMLQRQPRLTSTVADV